MISLYRNKLTNCGFMYTPSKLTKTSDKKGGLCHENDEGISH